MKKIIIFLIFTFTLIGCSINNTPTSKVEELMMKYQTLDEEISDEIEVVLSEQSLNLEQKNQFKELIEHQYKNMSYEIKEETIDGDMAVVRVAIEVIDYKKIIDKLESEYQDKINYTELEYNDEKIKRLKEAEDKITYTLDIDVLKTSDGKWQVDNLSNVDKKKIQGMY